jgi:hypothetical protein
MNLSDERESFETTVFSFDIEFVNGRPVLDVAV